MTFCESDLVRVDIVEWEWPSFTSIVGISLQEL